MTFITAVPLALLVVCVVLELVALSVYQPFVSGKRLDAFFDKHFSKYEASDLNSSGDMFYGLHDLPYISKFPIPLPLGRWMFGYDVGRIPRWSKWHKKLDELQKERHKPSIEKYL